MPSHSAKATPDQKDGFQRTTTPTAACPISSSGASILNESAWDNTKSTCMLRGKRRALDGRHDTFDGA